MQKNSGGGRYSAAALYLKVVEPFRGYGGARSRETLRIRVTRVSPTKVCTIVLIRTTFSDKPRPEFQIEWSKARARQAHWKEEVLLLREEMRRVLQFLKWKSNDWSRKGRADAISSLTTCPYQLEGLRAYVYRQANVFCDIHNHFLGIWKGLELPREHLAEPVYPANLSSDTMELDGEDL